MKTHTTKIIIGLVAMAFTGTGMAETESASTGHDESACAAKFEQDRQAILAMAGKYSVSFNFIETVALKSGYVPMKPYSSDADELVVVIEDTGKRIVLQHLLVVGGDHVVKHWRQEWIFEDANILNFRGHDTWELSEVPAEQRHGCWSQAVYQVDDSPRYEGYGQWEHNPESSSWESGATWRPLPRRERKRDDYDIIIARNRHTITPTGWVHEQDNLKRVLDEDESVITREVGLNTYTRNDAIDLSPAEKYWEETAHYWKDVRSSWEDLLREQGSVRVLSRVDGKRLTSVINTIADEVSGNPADYDTAITTARLEETLKRFVVAPVEKSLN